MSGWTEREHRNVKIVHYTTSSQIKMIVTSREPMQGPPGYEEKKEEIWFDYGSFKDLRDCIKETDFP